MKDIDEKLFNIIEQKISLALDQLSAGLRQQISYLFKELTPNYKNNIKSIIEKFIDTVRLNLINEFDNIELLLKRIIKEANQGLSEELKRELYKSIENKIHENKFLPLFQNFINSLRSSISRFGIPPEKININSDFHSSKYHVMVKNMIRTRMKNLDTELSLLTFSYQNGKLEEEVAMKKVS